MNINFLKNKEMSKTIYESNRNKRSQSRDSLSKFVNNLSISNMDSVRIQLGMLSMLTLQSDELSRSSQVNFHFKNREYTSLFY